ncbi:hypothetical protein HPS57_12295 [Prevotella sp. PINT]|uniref:hypothetical protein n=1 Tax=Palleniella intestinalis TaxID=2736291 RepID=UPI001553CA61|nr:hypothetical protein [Palleniella intestinalis]NPD82747.1 hypothetical protein [Palleniella intestinalis]
MDINIEQRIKDITAKLYDDGVALDDPIAKLMLTTLTYQAERIVDEIRALPRKVTERLCDVFIPNDKLAAMPALALVQVFLKQKKMQEAKWMSENAMFSYKTSNAKHPLNYIPVFKNLIVPCNKKHILTSHILKSDDEVSPVTMGHKGHVWLGIESDADFDTLCGLSLLVRGTNGLAPKHIYVGSEQTELQFATMERMEDIPMLEPFDSQQSSKAFFAIINEWRNALTEMHDDCLLCITDNKTDRDLFKGRAYPKAFQQSLESNDLDRFQPNTLWLLLDFGEQYEIPDKIDVLVNVVPVANININNVTLTQSSPIAKLTKEDDAYFVSVQQTSTASFRQGFDKVEDEIVIRDFDASCYDNNALFAEVRSLYNHFMDDYYAFLAYNGIKDGEAIRQLRESVNNIGKSVIAGFTPDDKFDGGVYAMRHINMADQSTTTKVSYLTTHGKRGNAPKVGQKMDNRKEAAFEKEAVVVADAMCGTDKPNADMRYELLRYYTLTEDRLYTKMDIDAFLRKEILFEFGKDEYPRISFTITVEGAAGARGLQRGLYIDVMFKDKKNYMKAVESGFDHKLQQRIANRSCISMPIIVTLKSLEE